MICPVTDKICTERDCKEEGCMEQKEEDGEETKETDACKAAY
jgi:hypothetical protein